MIVEALATCIFARIKGYKLTRLFYTWTFYPVLIVQCLLVAFQASIFFRTYYFVRFVPLLEPVVIFSFAFAMFNYKLYKPAVAGSASVVVGTLLNKLVIARNGGQMPVFPSLSYVTGYVTRDMLSSVDSLHVLGSDAAKLKIFTDYIDFGYSILSIGDVFIHLFFCIMLYHLIAASNKDIKE